MAYGTSDGAVLLSLLSPLCNSFKITHLKQTVFVYIKAQCKVCLKRNVFEGTCTPCVAICMVCICNSWNMAVDTVSTRP
jgi:hypothetical protein